MHISVMFANKNGMRWFFNMYRAKITFGIKNLVVVTDLVLILKNLCFRILIFPV